MKKYVFTVLGLSFVFLLTAKQTTAQPIFQSFGTTLERGANVGAGIQINDNRTLINGSVGYVTKNKFEFGVLVTRFRVDDIDDVRTGVGVYFTSNPVKQTEELPIGITVSSSYLYHIFSGDSFDALKDIGITTRGGQTFIGAGVNHLFQASPAMAVVPELEVGYVNTSITASASGQSETNRDTEFFMGLGVRVIVQNEGRPLSIMPRLRFADGESFGGISINAGIPAPSN